MEKTKRIQAEHLLEQYPKLKSRIQLRKAEILIHDSDDENIGGGKSGFIQKPEESMILAWESDSKLSELQRLYRDIKVFLNACTDDQKAICNMKYFSTDYYTWEEVADKLHFGHRTIYNKREAILELFSDIHYFI